MTCAVTTDHDSGNSYLVEKVPVSVGCDCGVEATAIVDFGAAYVVDCTASFGDGVPLVRCVVPDVAFGTIEVPE